MRRAPARRARLRLVLQEAQWHQHDPYLAVALAVAEGTSGVRRVNLRLVDLPHAVLLALRDGDVRNAETAVGLPIPDEFARQTDIWRFMLDRLSERPENAGWTMQALVRDDEIVGNAGFKGAPDGRGVVEIGYGVLATHRRQGLAVAACRLLLDRAAREPAVTQVVAIIDPDNAASLAVIDRAGFRPDGESVHERLGRRLRFVWSAAVVD